MGFQKGHKKIGGRKKGVENKDKKELREKLTLLLEDNYDKFLTELNKLSSSQYVNVFKDLLEYCTPKLNRTDLTNDGKEFNFSQLSDNELINELRQFIQVINREKSED